MPERWKDLTDVRGSLRLPVMLLVAAMLWVGFHPQSLVRVVSPAFKTYFSKVSK